MNDNDPPNKRVCVHIDASSKVTPTPTPVSRKFVNSSCYFVVSDFHLTLVFICSIPTLQLLTDSCC